jgi:hypothetical protein
MATPVVIHGEATFGAPAGGGLLSSKFDLEGDQSVLNNHWTQILWDTVEWDELGIGPGSSGLLNIVLPGTYLITAFSRVQGAGAGMWAASMYIEASSGDATDQGEFAWLPASDGDETALTVSGLHRFHAGDSFAIQVKQGSGAANTYDLATVSVTKISDSTY